MQGLAAIAAHNGWAMAATGASIVIIGLSVLSFIISQLHKIIEFLDKKEEPAPDLPATSEPAPTNLDMDVLADLKATAKLLQSFTVDLGDCFKLAELYKVLDAAQIPHPHITVRELKSAGYLALSDEGKFSWKNI